MHLLYLSKTHFVRDLLHNSIGNSSTSTTCNPICCEGTILELQITMEFCRPHMHEKHLKPHLQCGSRTAEVDHRRSGTHFVLKNTGFRASAICYLSKTHFVRDFLQNSIGNSSTSTTCNPIYSEGTISLLTLSVTNSFPH